MSLFTAECFRSFPLRVLRGLRKGAETAGGGKVHSRHASVKAVHLPLIRAANVCLIPLVLDSDRTHKEQPIREDGFSTQHSLNNNTEGRERRRGREGAKEEWKKRERKNERESGKGREGGKRKGEGGMRRNGER